MDKKILKELLAEQNVTSVGRGLKKVGGISTGRQCIVIGVIKKLSLEEIKKGTWVKLESGDSFLVGSEDIIPKVVGNEETDVIEIGEITLL